MYVCGLGGSDIVGGDRLRRGGDCASAHLVQADSTRVRAAVQSLRSMASFADKEPEIAQVCSPLD